MSDLADPERVRFVGPFSEHRVVVEGWTVPLLHAQPLDDNRIFLVLDDRLGLYLTTNEAERVIPFLADAIAVVLGYGAHPRGDENVEQMLTRRQYPYPRRVKEIFAVRSDDSESGPTKGDT